MIRSNEVFVLTLNQMLEQMDLLMKSDTVAFATFTQVIINCLLLHQ